MVFDLRESTAITWKEMGLGLTDADKKLLDLAEKANLPWVQTQNMRFGVKLWNALQECIAEWIGGVDRSTIPARWQSEIDYAQAAANAVPRLIAEKEALRNRIEAAHAICEVVACKDEPVGRAAQRWLAADDAAAKESSDD